jgi:hypothetical protein
MHVRLKVSAGRREGGREGGRKGEEQIDERERKTGASERAR